MRLLYPLTAVTLLLTGGLLSAPSPRSGAPYSQWENGPPADPRYFPIGVWLQQPKNALRYKQAGINLYVGLWRGPTKEQLSVLKEAGMPVICDQNAVGLAHQNDPTIIGWMHNDEPDNAQPVTDLETGKQSYGPPVPPSKIVSDYMRLRANDPTRPVFLNLGQGVVNDQWIGRGPGARQSDYLTYVKGADIVSFDVYPIAGMDRPDGENYLWYVARGVERLRNWTEGRKILWNVIECTRIGSNRKPTPHQVRAEVWMSLIHGSRGIVWFVHEFSPKFNETALLDDPEMLKAVTTINKQIHELAPVLNRPTPQYGAQVTSTEKEVPIAFMAKRHEGWTYLFTCGMRNGKTRARLEIMGVPNATEVEVIGEGRKLKIKDGKFEDRFDPYDVHLYRVRSE